ncbi:MAG: winged helix-turn-helix domain-containing protein [Solirubrobacteraceae bacterium]
MDVRERERGDGARLEDLVDAEPNAKQRDRYRVALLALQKEPTEEIMRMLRRSRGFVQRWAYAYRDGGIGALLPQKPKGRPVILAREKESEFLARIDAGPTEVDGVCAFTCHDARRILEEEFQAKYTYEGARCALHRMGYTPLRPRPRHEDHDPAAIEAFKRSAPFLSRA